MTFLNHQQANGLVVVPLIDVTPSRVVVAWNEGETNPLVRPDRDRRLSRPSTH